MRTRRPFRAEDAEGYLTYLGVGTTHSVSGPEDVPAAGALWVPDPEGRHGWRELYVGRTDAKPGARPLGFGKPGARP